MTKTETIKIDLKGSKDFSDREKKINTEIQKHIDFLNSRGFIVIRYDVTNKSNTYAAVKFSLKRMVLA